MWEDSGRRIDFKLADESLFDIEELDSKVSFRFPGHALPYFERFVSSI
jgi:hypothetical protein